MTNSTHTTFASLVIAIAGTACLAQSVTFRVLADWNSTFRPRGDRPALHNGVVAFLGDEPGPDPTRWAVFRGPLDGSVPFQPVAYGEMTRGDQIPWRTDNSWFVGFGNPVVWNSSVIFDADRSNNGTGTFAEGAVVSTSAGFSRYGASIGSPSAGPLGLVQPVSFRKNDQTIVQVVPINAPLPGGGTSASTSSGRTSGVLEGWAYGGAKAVTTTRVNVPGDFGYGLYAYDPATAGMPLTMLANPFTPFPNSGGVIEYITGADTDGRSVSFSATTGTIGQGGTSAILVTPIESGSLTTIARTGTMSPSGQPYQLLGNTSINGDAIFFDASIGPDISNLSYAVFASCRGNVVPVWKTGDIINGKVMVDGRVNHRAAEGNDLVMWARYQNPAAPLGLGVMLLHVHLGCDTVCPADLDNGSGTGTRDGAITIDDLIFFLNAFENGGTAADLDDGSGNGTADSAVTIEDLLYFLTRFEAGC